MEAGLVTMLVHATNLMRRVEFHPRHLRHAVMELLRPEKLAIMAVQTVRVPRHVQPRAQSIAARHHPLAVIYFAILGSERIAILVRQTAGAVHLHRLHLRHHHRAV